MIPPGTPRPLDLGSLGLDAATTPAATVPTTPTVSVPSNDSGLLTAPVPSPPRVYSNLTTVSRANLTYKRHSLKKVTTL